MFSEVSDETEVRNARCLSGAEFTGACVIYILSVHQTLDFIIPPASVVYPWRKGRLVLFQPLPVKADKGNSTHSISHAPQQSNLWMNPFTPISRHLRGYCKDTGNLVKDNEQGYSLVGGLPLTYSEIGGWFGSSSKPLDPVLASSPPARPLVVVRKSPLSHWSPVYVREGLTSPGGTQWKIQCETINERSLHHDSYLQKDFSPALSIHSDAWRLPCPAQLHRKLRKPLSALKQLGLLSGFLSDRIFRINMGLGLGSLIPRLSERRGGCPFFSLYKSKRAGKISFPFVPLCVVAAIANTNRKSADINLTVPEHCGNTEPAATESHYLSKELLYREEVSQRIIRWKASLSESGAGSTRRTCKIDLLETRRQHRLEPTTKVTRIAPNRNAARLQRDVESEERKKTQLSKAFRVCRNSSDCVTPKGVTAENAINETEKRTLRLALLVLCGNVTYTSLTVVSGLSSVRSHRNTLRPTNNIYGEKKITFGFPEPGCLQC
ncbi:hypothetical protein J6590_060767 [Homalodisca vitripennis]|nr:hypothetical protein J6590_060767 [Homalodisca vitripennis]